MEMVYSRMQPPGPSSILVLHEKVVAIPLGEILPPTVAPEQKPLAQ